MRLKSSDSKRWEWRNQNSNKISFFLAGSYGLTVAMSWLFPDVSDVLLSFFIATDLELYHKLSEP